MKKLVLLLSLFSFSIASAQFWTQKKSVPTAGLRAPAVFTIGTKAYLVSGNGPGVYTSEVWEYSQEYDIWTKKSDFPGAPRFSSMGFSINGKGYLIGGTADAVTVCYNDVWEYTPATDSWDSLGIFPGNCRDLATVFVVGSKAYYGTGRSFANLNQPLSDFWEFDPQTFSWTQLTSVPGAGRGGAISWVLGDKAYVGYGFGAGGTQQSDLYEFDPVAKTWSNKNPFGMTTSSPAQFAIGDFGFIAGGPIHSQFNESDECWTYNPFLNLWIPMPPLPGAARVAAMGFAIGNYGYVVLGSSNAQPYMKDLYEFTPSPLMLKTGVDELSKNEAGVIYPNPVVDRLFISQGNSGINDIKILNVSGQQISDGITIGDKGLDISGLVTGVYFLEYTNGTSIVHQRFVKL